MLEIQKYLRSGKTPDDLCDELNIDYFYHETLPLIGFNYRVTAPKFERIVRECRGLVLEQATWDVVGKPITRFFNYGEHPEETANFDWSDFRMYEKVDGTAIILSPYKGDWIVSTRGTFGNRLVGSSGKTWEELFWETAPHLSKDSFSPDTCYMFELWTPHNTIITRYDTPRVWLLYAYDLESGREWSHHTYVSEAQRLRVLKPINFGFCDSYEHIKGFLDKASEGDPTFEGVVLHDRNGIRLKIKTEAYLKLHYFYGNGNLHCPKRLVPLWLSGDYGEVLSYFPDVKEPLADVGAKCDEARDQLWELYRTVCDIKDQKEFAQMILPRTEFSAILFDVRKRYPNGVTREEFNEAWKQWDDLILKKLFAKETMWA